MSACPAEPVLFALVEGTLDPDALASVDEHLDSCALCREVVSALLPSADTESTAAASASDRLEAGQLVGRFQLIEPLGRGASGVVFSARDPELDRLVAIKLLTASTRQPEQARRRFLREARAMARLVHPNVVTVFDVGETKDSTVYLAMELVDGCNLREHLSREERSAEQVLSLFAQAARGLAAAHDAGLVHRDFKPDNVLVDRDGQLKVTDFGLARLGEAHKSEAREELAAVGHNTAASGDEDEPGPAPKEPVPELLTVSQLTRSGTLIGTPAYMAPEQLRGEAASVRSDVFAFAVSLYEALEQRRPFASRSLKERLIEMASPPAMPRIERLAPRVAKLLERSLRSEPGERPASMRVWVQALAPAPASRRYLAPSLAALTSLALLGAYLARPTALPSPDACAEHRLAGETLWGAAERERLSEHFGAQQSHISPQASEAVLATLDRYAERAQALRTDGCEQALVRHERSKLWFEARAGCLQRAGSSLTGVIGLLQQSDAQTLALAPDALTILPDLAACEAPLEASSPSAAAPADEAEKSLRARLTELRFDLATQRFPEARALAALLREEVTGRVPSALVVEVLRAEAEVLAATGDFDEAEKQAGAAVLAAEVVGETESRVHAWITRARIAGERGRYDQALQFGKLAEAALAHLGRPAALGAEVDALLGVANTNHGDFVEAKTRLEAALRWRAQSAGANSPEVARVLTNLGNLARLSGELDEALALHRRALAIDLGNLGPDHALVGRHHHNIAGVLRLQDDKLAALAEYALALKIKEAALGEHPEVALTENSLGLLNAELSRRPEARAHYQRALSMLEKSQHSDRALAHYNLGLLDLDEHSFAMAVGHFEAARTIDSERFGPQHKRVFGEWLGLARAHEALRQLSERDRALAAAREIAVALGLDEELAGLRSLEAQAPTTPAAVSPVPMPPATAAPPATAIPSAPAPTASSAPTTSPPAPTNKRPPQPGGSTVYAPGQAWD